MGPEQFARKSARIFARILSPSSGHVGGGVSTHRGLGYRTPAEVRAGSETGGDNAFLRGKRETVPRLVRRKGGTSPPLDECPQNARRVSQ